MRRIKFTLFITIFLTIYCLDVRCQTRALTENGDTIYVYNNGTWSFELVEQMPEVNELDFLTIELQIDTLDTEQIYSSSAKKEVKNSRNQFVFKYDETMWSRVPPATLNEEAEFAFQSKKSDIWCVVILEETPIEIDHLFRIAKKTMEENTGTETLILKTELRKVNGKSILRGALKAEFSGITFIFDTYYFSNDLGSVQFTTWTSEVVWKRNQDKILEFLNGFVVN